VRYVEEYRRGRTEDVDGRRGGRGRGRIKEKKRSEQQKSDASLSLYLEHFV